MLEEWFQRYKEWRPHVALGSLTPNAYDDQSVAAALTDARKGWGVARQING